MPLPSLSTTVPGLTPFDRAVHVVNISNMASQSPTGTADSDKVSFSPEDQLLLYGAYKQATKGDVKGLKPTFFDIAARSKWQAWANMRGKSHQEAQEIYVDLVVKCLTRSGGHPDLHQQADEILQRPPSPQSSLSRPGSPSASPNLDKDLPPIQIESPSAPYTTPLSITPASSISSHSPHQHHTQRKGSISHSIRSVTTGGMRSAAASVYELAPETLADSDVETAATGPTNSNSNHQSDAGYHEITETVVEEEILNDEEYAAEVHTSKSAPLDNVTAAMGESMDVEDATEHDRQDEDDDDDDDVYQSSEEYESDSDSITSESATSVASSSGKLTPSPQPNTLDQRFHPHNQDKDDLVDEGVFEEEEKDELKAEEEGLLGSPPALDAALSPEVDTLVGLQDQDDGSRYTATEKPRISRDGSVSSGYGGSVLSDKGVVSILDIRNIALSGKDEIFSKTEDPASPSVEPYRVHALHDTTIATPNTQDLEINGAETDSMTSKTSTTVQSVGKSEATPAHALDGLVCPVSKKTAASGAVCPAAMFAQARAAAETEKSGQSLKSGSLNTSTTPAVDDANAEPSLSPSAKHQRAMTEPAMTATTSAQEATSPPQSSLSQSAPTSAVTAATNQGKRIGQGIVSRFSALRNSLAAASARAASSALSGNPLGSSSSASKSTDNPYAVVVKDPITNQSVTVVCPHLTTTHLLETEVVRLQTDISVLHERLDLLQESLKVKSQTRAQERRSARGIFKLVLRQGLINAILLLIVFAVLYKRKSPIAFAILAYIGEGRREGEAGWRALMRWGADMIRVGQRNQQYMLRAGRRNGYW
ncbi:hypothetical protein BGZ67_000147 [Mortierella alpina]|nr:hypothetical protein BGZ67_000147 [Mortierella alpina]